MIPAWEAPENRAALPPTVVSALGRIAHSDGGLHIGPEKSDFLQARLNGQLARLDLPDFAAYAAHLEKPGNSVDRRLFIEALTTHTTSFFRENGQFEWLTKTGLPELAADGAGSSRALEVWSAACSSGQELYTTLMVCSSFKGENGRELNVRGVGTDLSGAILRRAEIAVYSREEIDGIPIALKRRFLLSAKDDKNRFRINAELRNKTRWVRANLTEGRDLSGVRADIAFLRNVLIYFDAPTRERVIRNVLSRIVPGGFLFTGHSETLDAKKFGLSAQRPCIYRKES